MWLAVGTIFLSISGATLLALCATDPCSFMWFYRIVMGMGWSFAAGCCIIIHDIRSRYNGRK